MFVQAIKLLCNLHSDIFLPFLLICLGLRLNFPTYITGHIRQSNIKTSILSLSRLDLCLLLYRMIKHCHDDLSYFYVILVHFYQVTFIFLNRFDYLFEILLCRRWEQVPLHPNFLTGFEKLDILFFDKVLMFRECLPQFLRSVLLGQSKTSPELCVRFFQIREFGCHLFGIFRKKVFVWKLHLFQNFKPGVTAFLDLSEQVTRWVTWLLHSLGYFR